MKPSKYNFFFPIEEGKYLAFNALKNGLAVCSEKLRKEIESLEPGNTPHITDTLLTELKKGGFFCDDNCDEYDLLTVRRHLQQYNSSALGFTIAPTIACNLACAYCFESPDPKVMDDKVIDALVKFIKNKTKEGLSRLSVTWYGGEPTLCMDVIEKISTEFMAVCDEHKMEYSAYMVTNGTLYTKKVAEKLKELKVTGVQITIDGDRETHDKRRPFHGGKGTFDIIFKNIKDTMGILPISIRTNVDINNMAIVPGFYEKLKDEDWFGKHYGKMLRVHYGYVRKMTKSCGCSHEETLKPGDFYKNELEMRKFLYRNGYEFNYYPDTSSGCCATRVNSYLVGPGGELYKCWNHIGLPEESVGTIFEPIQLNPHYVSYLAESFEKDDECKECKYLPICMGGCVDMRVKAKQGEFDSKNCSGWKYYLEETLKQFYLSKMENKESK